MTYLAPHGRVLTPYLCCRDAAKAIEWYGEIFGARPTETPFVGADGRIGHAELEIDGAAFMLSDAYPEVGVASPAPDGLPTYAMNLYVPDVDATVNAAEKAGATIEKPLADTFYGARAATFRDPFGVRWSVATHLRDVGEAALDAAKAGFADK
ncbi:VOC family protein [Kribbella sp. CA-293567]|uniref:VOC family protein n=1 Tax=Kribbella sp. CA-293567 TaxID=3002436 RepID=UPI0022DD8CC7|nr:VOC family protein [Kribbella sp. CA-293567]WBQ02025.1 VOC family protein [Kribbella sp. CA-293567]